MSERYLYQEKLPFWGEKSQNILAAKTALIIGCGALGSHLAEQLARSGIGRLILMDDDVVNESNLPRVALFTAADCGHPKAEIAASRLTLINPQLKISWARVRATAENLPYWLKQADILLDGTDNMASRLLINRLCYQLDKPWVYGGVLATGGMVLPILPGKTACLQCLLPTLTAESEPPTTSEKGILSSLPAIVACFQNLAALKILTGQAGFSPKLLTIDPWFEECSYLAVERNKNCPLCGSRAEEIK